jgi:peptide/nickel transport system substrate-binding protein
MRQATLTMMLVGLALLSGCAPASKAPPQPGAAASAPAQASGPSRITIIYGSQPIESLNPYAQSAGITYATWKHVFETLVHWDSANRQMVPLLASSWENPRPDVWRFHLRQGVKFHDGSELTADDVVHSLGRILNDPDSKQKGQLSSVAALEAPDRYTVDVVTKGPDATLLDILWQRVITSKAHYDRLGRDAADAQPIGTGPYRFKEWVPGQRFVVERDPGYDGPNRATVDEVVFRAIPEDEARVTALLNGEADIVTYLAPQLAPRVESRQDVRVARAPGQRMMFLAMNPQYKPWDNLLVRQAVSYAVDRGELIDGVLGGHAYPLDAPIGPPQFSYSPDLGPKYQHDPERARQLLAQAGYPNGLDVEMFAPNGRYIKDKELAQALVGQLARVGIRAKLTAQDWGIFWPAVGDGKIPFWFGGRGSIIDPDEYLQQYFRTGVSKRIGFSDPTVDALLDQERTIFDPAERIKVLHQGMTEIMQRAPVAFLFMYEDTYGVSNRLEWTPRTDEHVYGWDVRLK